MKPAARIAGFEFSVSAKSAAAPRYSKKVLIRLFDLAGPCAAALTWTGIRKDRVQTCRRHFWTDPAAGRFVRRLHRCFTTLLHNPWG
jgi:hypothetical protein